MSDQTSYTLDVVLPSDPHKLEQFIEKVEVFLKKHLDDEDYVYQIILLTSEAVTNGMEHGNKFDPDKKVFFRLAVETDEVTLRVSDEGAGFERTTINNPLKEESLLLEGGRGIFLIEQIADTVRYSDGGRTINLSVARP